MARLEFFFDCSSPWTYLAFHRIEEVVSEDGAELIFRPILVGGVFNSVNPSVYEARSAPVPAKLAYYAKDLADWANHYGIRIGMPLDQWELVDDERTLRDGFTWVPIKKVSTLCAYSPREFAPAIRAAPFIVCSCRSKLSKCSAASLSSLQD